MDSFTVRPSEMKSHHSKQENTPPSRWYGGVRGGPGVRRRLENHQKSHAKQNNDAKKQI